MGYRFEHMTAQELTEAMNQALEALEEAEESDGGETEEDEDE